MPTAAEKEECLIPVRLKLTRNFEKIPMKDHPNIMTGRYLGMQNKPYVGNKYYIPHQGVYHPRRPENLEKRL